ncbi:hypothetical protein Pdw03_3354 [Penicillium digitatum]|uniref:Uncharacterized protein n=3 Tax=Penicillium digitatum TaxID=36651 RepID=K9FHC6_PEND2|nr:hypothetical protein PDIP_81170 [Penicillium digitatum Pd1]EKV05761.1 hypothetical protein PDIP_81170 [Penicillium digitatum Pd1]EKV07577.1 hypothetical protein PDIG_71900 [Penicillium digitatum PHI26]KAG0161225.1 hypothetical protein PDIDSM_8759 [Penicillium digitatum]QQK40500.1 hypothetical protein Pdw03_3354 [Penicillium digitatum]
MPIDIDHARNYASSRQTTTPLSSQEEKDLILEALALRKEKLRALASIVNNMSAELTDREIVHMYYRVEVGSYLLPASNFIANENPSEAEAMVKLARESANKSKNPLLVAKCEFWMGRVEFLRGNMRKAHEHFVKANLCAMDPKEGVECQDLSFFLDITRHGISEQTRAARLRAHEEAIAAHVRFDKTTNNSVSTEVKRKRPLRTWKGALVKLQLPLVKQRPLAKIRKPRCKVPTRRKVDEKHLQQEIDDETSLKNEVLGKVLAEELGYETWSDSEDDTDTDTDNESDDDHSGDPADGTDDTADEKAEKSPDAPDKPRESEPSIDPPTAPVKVPSDQAAYEMPKPGSARARFRQECFHMGLTSVLNGEPYERPKEPFVFGIPHEPTKQTQFRLGFFKVGLAKRCRPMTIFPKQDGEITISPEEWKSIEHDARNKIVTYEYLRRERYELIKVAEEM